VVAVFGFGATPVTADYLFGVSDPGYEHLSSGMVWDAALELRSRGVELLNLGGGVRAGDGVAVFKQRFGPDARPLRTLRSVYRPQEHEALCRAAGADPEERHGFFPPYRRSERG
jgi:hypothetical protein